jgi:hypothetical protein
MKPSDFIKEHAVKPAKQTKPQNIEQLKEQCYRCATDSISIRSTLAENKIAVDPWVAKKIATAQECLEAVKQWIKDSELHEDASAGATGSASVAAVATPLLKKRKVVKRTMKEEVGTLPKGPSASTIKPLAPINKQDTGADDPAELGALEKIINDPTLKQDLDTITAIAKGEQPGQQDQNSLSSTSTTGQQPAQDAGSTEQQPEFLDKATLEKIKSNSALKQQYDQLLKKVV